MANKWKWKAMESNYGVITLYRNVDEYHYEDYTLHEKFETLASAQKLAADLNELELLREERRWRRIGEEWPEDGQMCQMSTGGSPCPQNFNYRADDGVWGHTMIGVVAANGDWFEGQCTFTHWRPVPMDVPKENGRS